MKLATKVTANRGFLVCVTLFLLKQTHVLLWYAPPPRLPPSGFHVIEVHAGQARNGAAIQNLLFEATQSRHVDFSAAHARDFYANQAVAAVTESTITATTGVASSLFGGGKAKAGKGNSAADNSKPPAKKKPTSDAAMKKAEAAAAAAEAAAAAKALKEKEKAAAKAKAVAKSHAKLTLILFEEVDAAWALEQASAQEKANHAYNHDANNGGINANGSGSSSSNSGSGSGGGGGAVARGRVAADDDTAANGVDLGFFASLKMLIRSSKCPIVLTANSVPQAKDFERLKCRVVPLAPPPLNEVEQIFGFFLPKSLTLLLIFPLPYLSFD